MQNTLTKSNYLFLDLDECMVHSNYANDEKHADQLIDMYGEHWAGVKFQIRNDGWYVSFIRSWTRELLTFSRQLLGNNNVHMLSTGTLNYIRWVNVHLKLGFDPNTNIFGREDLQCQWAAHPKFRDTFNVLVDNEDWYYHSTGQCSKVAFLTNLPMEQLIQVPKFEVYTETIDKQKQQEQFDDVKDRIMKVFKY
jgi:hypothetical protein